MSRGKTERVREEYGDVSISSSIDVNMIKGASKLTLVKYSTSSDKEKEGEQAFNGQDSERVLTSQRIPGSEFQNTPPLTKRMKKGGQVSNSNSRKDLNLLDSQTLQKLLLQQANST